MLNSTNASSTVSSSVTLKPYTFTTVENSALLNFSSQYPYFAHIFTKILNTSYATHHYRHYLTQKSIMWSPLFTHKTQYLTFISRFVSMCALFHGTEELVFFVLQHRNDILLPLEKQQSSCELENWTSRPEY